MGSRCHSKPEPPPVPTTRSPPASSPPPPPSLLSRLFFTFTFLLCYVATLNTWSPSLTSFWCLNRRADVLSPQCESSLSIKRTEKLLSICNSHFVTSRSLLHPLMSVQPEERIIFTRTLSNWFQMWEEVAKSQNKKFLLLWDLLIQSYGSSLLYLKSHKGKKLAVYLRELQIRGISTLFLCSHPFNHFTASQIYRVSGELAAPWHSNRKAFVLIWN